MPEVEVKKTEEELRREEIEALLKNPSVKLGTLKVGRETKRKLDGDYTLCSAVAEQSIDLSDPGTDVLKSIRLARLLISDEIEHQFKDEQKQRMAAKQTKW